MTCKSLTNMNSLIHYLVKNKLILLLFTLTLISCTRKKVPVEIVETKPEIQKITQGLSGKILFKEGEFSSTGEILDNGKVFGIERQLFIYEPTNIRDVEIGEGDFVKYTSTELIDSVNSDKHGNFSKELPIGKYSLFIKESQRLYSKLGDNDYFLPVTIMKDSATTIIIEVDYKASYLSGQ